MPSDTLDRATVEAFLGAPFPASATNLHTAGDAALDTVVVARLDLPRADVEPYLAELGLLEATPMDFDPFGGRAPGGTGDWWDLPARTEDATYLSHSGGGAGPSFTIALVEGHGDTVTLYIRAFNQ